MRPSSFVLIAALLTTSALASPGPQPAPPTPPLPQARDIPYPGTIALKVDATDVQRRIFRVRQTMPVQPGRLTLLYPQWLPGAHSPRGPIDKLAGLTISGGGQRIAWTRDPVEVHAFHVDVPVGVSSLDIVFQYLSPTDTDQGSIVITPAMLNLEWNALVLYPAGHFTRVIPVRPSVTLPAGWRFGVALDGAQTSGSTTTFAVTNVETLVDSPMFAGANYTQIDLDPGGRSPVRLNIVADKPELLAAKPEHIAAHRALVTQADRLFGARPFDRYDFLLSLSDEMGGIGLEHHRSSQNGTYPDYFTGWDKGSARRDLLAHEYAHSWNGKFRRGADSWTPTFSAPIRNSLLWVYEGGTQYFGNVLASRSGLMSVQDGLDSLAIVAALYDARVGRAWRPLQDTVNQPIMSQRRPQPWVSWQRGGLLLRGAADLA